MRTLKCRQIEGILTILLLTSLIGSCSGQEEVESQSSASPIILDAVINQGAVTRFTDYEANATQSKTIYPGQTVWAWALYHTNNSNTYMTAWRLTANPSGTLAGSAKYYPDNGNAIDIIAVQGNFSQTIDEANDSYSAFPTSLTHSVKDDQRVLSDYASSDLLYARVDNRKGSDNSVVTLPFKHYLSKIEVTLESEDYTREELEHATIKIVGVQMSTTISLNTGSATTEPTLTTSTDNSGEILLKEGTEGNARGVGDASNGRDYIEAVVPPQELAQGDAFIEVTLTSRNNRLLIYQVPATGFNTDEGFSEAQKRTLMANRRYQFVFTLFESNITLSGATYQDGYDDQTVEVIPEA